MNRYFLKNLVLVFILVGHPLFLQANVLHDAINTGNYDQASRLISEQPDLIHGCDGYGATPLRSAACANHVRLVRSLLDKGALVDASDNQKNTALHGAADHLSTEAAFMLLLSGANVHAKNAIGKAPLHLAASPLPSAPREKQLAMIQLLKDFGAKLDARDKCGNTPLRYAIRGRTQTESGKKVIRKSAKPVEPTENIFFNAAAQKLIDLGACVNVRDKIKSMTLHTAAFMGNIEAVGMLLRVSGINLSAVNKKNQTPYESAIEGGHYDIAELIRQAEEAATLMGSQTNILKLTVHTEEDGVAAEEEEYDGGEDDSALDRDGQTPCESAIEGGHGYIKGLIASRIVYPEPMQIPVDLSAS